MYIQEAVTELHIHWLFRRRKRLKGTEKFCASQPVVTLDLSSAKASRVAPDCGMLHTYHRLFR